MFIKSKALRFNCLIIFCFSMWTLSCFSQELDAVHVNIVPTNNIYAVFFDRDGFMWIGSDLGLARFDGTNTTVIKPYKLNTGIGSIVQDEAGRIWCIGEDHSAYYVKDDALVLIRSATRREWVNSVMSYRGKVYLTTDNGLVVYDVITLARRGYKIDLHPFFGKDIFNVGGAIFLYSINFKGLLLFDGSSFKKIDIPIISKWRPYYFQGNNGRLYSVPFQNPFKKEKQIISELIFADGKFKVINQIDYNSSEINSISPVAGNGYWVNTKNGSFSNQHEVYRGYNTFEVIQDMEGNNWFRSKNGLFVSYKRTAVRSVENVKEKIFSMAKKDGFLYLGATGKIFKYDILKRQTVKTIPIPEWKWEVGFIKHLSGHEFVVQSNILIYFFNDSTMAFKRLGGASYLNNTVQFGDLVYMSSASLSYYFNIHKPEADDSTMVPAKLFYKYCHNCLLSIPDAAVIPEINRIIFATDDNLMKFRPGNSEFIKYNGQPIIASALFYGNSKLYIATTRFGILVYENGLVRQLIKPEIIGPEKISKIRPVGSNFWLMNPGAVKLIDIKTGQMVKNDITGDYNVADVETERNTAYFISANKLYRVDLRNVVAKASPTCKNLFTIINGKDTIYSHNISVAHDKNDLQFNLSFPVYGSPEKTRFSYRLKGARDIKWKFTNSQGGGVRFASLMPGRYTFEAFAVHPYMGNSENIAICNFIIVPPWWDTWLFKTGFILFALTVMVILIRRYYKAKLSRQKIFFENELAIEKERYRISREIHDDIGQSLSVIKLNLNIGAPAQLKEAKAIITDVIENLRNLTHTLANGKRLVNGLPTSVRTDIARLNAAKQVSAGLKVTGHETGLTPEQELGAYRIYQEAVNNTLKHADAKHIEVAIHFALNEFVMTISDDGNGFGPAKGSHGQGLTNMRGRAAEMGGKLIIESTTGSGTKIRLVVPAPNKK